MNDIFYEVFKISSFTFEKINPDVQIISETNNSTQFKTMINHRYSKVYIKYINQNKFNLTIIKRKNTVELYTFDNSEDLFNFLITKCEINVF